MLSKHEAFGIVFCEAVGYGVPAIATNVGGIPAIIEHDRTGLMFAVYEKPATIVGQINALYGDPRRYSGFASAARQRLQPGESERMGRCRRVRRARQRGNGCP